MFGNEMTVSNFWCIAVENWCQRTLKLSWLHIGWWHPWWQWPCLPLDQLAWWVNIFVAFELYIIPWTTYGGKLGGNVTTTLFERSINLLAFATVVRLKMWPSKSLILPLNVLVDLVLLFAPQWLQWPMPTRLWLKLLSQLPQLPWPSILAKL